MTKTCESNLQEEEDDFRSCIEDEDVFKEMEEETAMIHFKGVSIDDVSGIGVVMELAGTASPIQVQKKLDFFVQHLVAEYLALLDALSVAIHHNINHVVAFTDSQLLYNQIVDNESIDTPLLLAFRNRILQQAGDLETFVLKHVASVQLQKALHLAQVAVGVVSFAVDGVENCSICCEDKHSSTMLTIKCSHKFCSSCMKTYTESKLRSSRVPVRCPHVGCRYCLSTAECQSFLPVSSYQSLERAVDEADVFSSGKMYCPYSNCSVLLDPRECSFNQSGNGCMECPICCRFICVDCRVPWHSSMTCEEYQIIPLEERDASDLTLHRLAQLKKWRRCPQCRRMIELAHGCCHMTCWCGHEFCYSCGAHYRDGHQTCQCAFWDEDHTEELVAYDSNQESEQWTWDSFESFPMIMDVHSEQERSQLALIQRFLAGSFSLTDHRPYKSPPHCTDSYADAMKDLHGLPWLEQFVSVISDTHDDYIQ